MKMYKFVKDGKEVFVIAETETEARQKAKLTEDFEMVTFHWLNEDW